jgi:hypothetical protein
MAYGFHLDCPVTGIGCLIGDYDSYDDAQYAKACFAYLAQTYWLGVWEIYFMVDLAARELDPDHDEVEMADLLHQASQDRESLRLNKHLLRPLEGAIEVWLRERERMRYVALLCSAEKRAKIEAFLEQREAGMIAILMRAKQRTCQ